MDRKHNKSIVPVARMLRKNMTKEERHLWYDFLCKYPVRFSRQKVLGKYIVDFFCAKAELIIELDGSQHYEEKNIKKDYERTKYLEGYGLQVLRIPNNEVNLNFYGVCEYIDAAVKSKLKK
ncbi:MAG: endonuclease domain-containing protein [Clostridia bacterium]|nr:endonuclease domain-containing protein [Clostridia bacterium]